MLDESKDDPYPTFEPSASTLDDQLSESFFLVPSFSISIAKFR